MRNQVLFIVGITLLTGFCFNGSAQPETPLKLTIDNLYKNNLFTQKGIQSLRWMEDGRQYSFLEGNNLNGGKDLVACDAATAQKKVLVHAGKLIPPGGKSPISISDYFWSGDNQKLYDNIYQKRYMNLPANNEQGYRDGSPITHAKNLKGNLLLIHGSGDDNCHYQSCQMLVNELIRQNRYFTMIDYPMRSHSINERENTTVHLRMTMLNYLKLNLPAGAK